MHECKRITVVTTCYNEEGNVEALASQVREVFETVLGGRYDYEHIFADNASRDGTLPILRRLAAADPRIKVIANLRNVGQPRSVLNAIRAASGDAVILLVADLQDPPEMIVDFLQRWEQGYKVVFGIRAKRNEGTIKTALRKLYYRLLRRLSEDELVNDAGEFCLFDKDVLHVIAGVNDPFPYLRGLIMSLGYPWTGIDYVMRPRLRGKSTINLFGNYVYALNGFIHHTLTPLRIASFLGLVMSLTCFGIAVIQFVLKILFWDQAPAGLPTLTIGLYFIGSIQLFILGYIGELLGSLYIQSKGLPLVVEAERINFDRT